MSLIQQKTGIGYARKAPATSRPNQVTALQTGCLRHQSFNIQRGHATRVASFDRLDMGRF